MRWVGWRPACAETANQRSPQDEEQTIIPARTLLQALAIADELYAVRPFPPCYSISSLIPPYSDNTEYTMRESKERLRLRGEPYLRKCCG